MKIVTVVGARPQFVKASVVSRELLRHNDVEEVLIHTGQHFDSNMSDVFFEEMCIPEPNYHLGIGGSSQGAMTGQMIEKIEAVLSLEVPDYVLLYGDTNSTLAGAIAASKLNIRVVHIEAGLRSFNMRMPEEVNRILTDRVSSLLFCPTPVARENLLSEGLELWKARAFLVGDVMQDAAYFYKEKAIRPAVEVLNGDFILCTIHRAENTDNELKLREIFDALNTISRTCNIIIPLHPRTKAKISEFGISVEDGVQIIEPIGYLGMIWLIQNCRLVMTDSGGLQKEAFFFSKYCVTLREETEWVELISEGVNILTGTCSDNIISAYEKFSSGTVASFNQALYGGGCASQEIVAIMRREL